MYESGNLDEAMRASKEGLELCHSLQVPRKNDDTDDVFVRVLFVFFGGKWEIKFPVLGCPVGS